MIASTAFTQLRYSPLLLAGTVLGLAITYIVPPLLALHGVPAGIAAWILMMALYSPALSYYRVSLLWAPLLPAAAIFYMAATIASAIRYATGKGGQWKGRSQAVR